MNKNRYKDEYRKTAKWWGRFILVWIAAGLLVFPLLALGQNNQQETRKMVTAHALELFQHMQINEDIASSAILNEMISLHIEEATLTEALQEIAAQADLELSYSRSVVSLEQDKTLTVHEDQITVNDILWKVLEGTGLRFAVSTNGNLVLMKREEIELETVQLQDFVVEGTVVSSEDGASMPGVTVVEVGTQRGTVTDGEGNFSLNVSGPDAMLRFTFVGYQAVEVNVEGRSEITVGMALEVVALEDVVVTALGLERDRKAIGYSVTQVRSEDLVQATEGNLANMLQGQVAGVNIESTAGGLGSSSRVVIRGVSNISGHNQPLYVVDGVPIDNRVTGGGQSGNVGRWGGATDGGDGISSLNPADIESITILRGASAAALYGERAQHGVILITTKRGRAGSVQIGFTNTTTFDQIDTSHLDYQTSYGQGSWGLRPQDADEAGSQMRQSWGERYDGQPVVQMDGNLYPYEDLGNPGHRTSDFFRTGISLRNDLSVSGGVETATYYFSASNLSQQGVVPNSDLGRTSLAVRGTAMFGRLNADVRANYITEQVNNRRKLGFGAHNIYTPFIEFARNVPMEVLQQNVYAPDGFSQFVLPSGGTFQANPYWVLDEEGQEDNRNRLIGYVKLDFELMNWLVLTGRTGIDTYTQRRTEWIGKGHARVVGGQFNERNLNVRELNAELFLTGTYQLTPSLSVDGMLGAAVRNSQDETLGFNGTNYIFPRLNTIGNMEDITSVYGFSEKEIRSVYGALNMGYNDYLFLNLTARNDWSSTLPANNNSFFYPSIGTSFVFSEAFASVLPEWLSFGQLRASWAEVGSDTDPYQLSLNYSLIETAFLGQQMSQVAGGTVPLADLKPSLTQEVELGADIRFFDDRLGFEFAWYDRNAINQILSASISSASGYTGRWINAGRLENTGYEVQITGIPILRTDFMWRTTVNYSRNKNIVKELIEGTDFITLYQPRHNLLSVRAEVEREFGEIYGSTFVRDDEGNIVHNNGVPIVGEQDVLGRGTPTWTGGWSNMISWRNFTLNTTIDVRWGGQFVSETNRKMTLQGLHKWTLDGRAECDAAPRNAATGQYLNCFVGEGVMQARDVNNQLVFDEAGNPVYVPNNVAVVPQQYYGNNLAGESGIAEAFLYDANIIYMRQIQLGYRLPEALISRFGLRGASVAVVARNPFVIYSSIPNIDPTTGVNRGHGQGIEDTNAPSTRNIGFSVNLQF